MSLRASLVSATLIAASAFNFACTGAPATIEFVDVSPTKPRVGEIATVRFRLTDYRGVPQAGSLVSFTIEGGNEGIILNPAMALSIKGSGEVSTQIIAGTAGQAITVVANAGSGKIAKSQPITFTGTVPNQNQFTFQCGSIAGEASGGVHAIGAYDDTRYLIAGVKLNCTAHVGDRYGDGVPNVQVSFYTEAGTINPTESTATDVAGNATVLYKTSLPMPHDTDPLVFNWNPDTTCGATDKALCNGEYLVPLWMEPNTWTTNPMGTLLNMNPAFDPNNLREPRRFDPVRRVASNPTQMPVNNPRDNLVTLIAYTNGEEGFIDKNANNTFDADEEPIDQTEPFVDSNDNGTYDPDEKYIDTNGSGTWDGKDGNWNASTIIWRQERILWTGIPYRAKQPGQRDDVQAPEPTMKGGLTLGAPTTIGCNGGQAYFLLASDPWWNTMAQNGTGDGCKKKAASKAVEVEERSGTSGFAFTYPPIKAYGYIVKDNLTREPMPMTSPPSPGCFPAATPFTWIVDVACEFTASPEDGHTVVLPDSVVGTIVSNLP